MTSLLGSFLVVAPAAAEPGPGGDARSVSGYRMTMLFDGEAAGVDLNEHGVIAGNIGSNYAVIWKDARLRFIENPPVENTFASAINDTGLVAGTAYPRPVRPNGRSRAVVWSGGRRIDLGVDGWPVAVNDRGVVVGLAFPAKPTASSPWKVYAFRWSQRRGLEPLTRYGLAMSSALRVTDINEAGQIVGHDASGPFRLTGTRLERPPHGSGLVDAVAIDERGDVAGTRAVAGVRWEAAVWTHEGTVRTVATIGSYAPGGRRLPGSVTDMNNRGQLIGQATRWLASDGYPAAEATSPFVLDHGVLTFLPDLSGGVRRINDAGVIVGSSGLVMGGGVITWAPEPVDG